MPAPRSNLFDDIYFSPDDGFAEARHVFLKGNDLPNRWVGRPHFTILELGFGTGLNMLAAATAFCASAAPHQSLHLYSIDKYPLDARTIAQALHPFCGALNPCLDRMLQDYPMQTGGWHTVWLDPRVRLTIIMDDVRRAVEGMHERCDAFFLDGFAPAKNPEMWDPALFRRMADLANPGATYATFTAASAVRSGLMQAGFTVNKTKGYGRKRDMVQGQIGGTSAGPARSRTQSGPQRITIHGAGLAGSASAHVLRGRGHHVTVIDHAADYAVAASLNARGMINPRFAATRSPIADYFMSAFARFERFTRTAPSIIDYRRHGALHLFHDPRKTLKLTGALERWGWHSDHMRLLDPCSASDIAGVVVDYLCLYLPDAASVSPAALCAHWRGGPFSGRMEQTYQDTDHVIIARMLGGGLEDFQLPPHRLFGGQVTYVAANAISHALRCAVHYGGYCAPQVDGVHTLGSTFHRDDDGVIPTADDDTQNQETLHRCIPSLASMKDITGSRRAVRVNTPDSTPLVGGLSVASPQPHWITGAHGSHGIISALMAADILADRIEGRAPALPKATLAVIDPVRFRLLPADAKMPASHE